MNPWRQLADRFLLAHGVDSEAAAESRVGPLDAISSPENLAAFRICEPDDALIFQEMLRDPLHRLFVKLLILGTRTVPDPLLDDVIHAAVMTRNPSFNKHFVFPAAIVFGRRRVLDEMLHMFTNGSNREKCGVHRAVYWCSIAREQMRWPHEVGRDAYRPAPDEPIDDLVRDFEERALREFLANPDVDVQRSLVSVLHRASHHAPKLANEAIAVAREHSDEYIRSRILNDLGRSVLIPSKP